MTAPNAPALLRQPAPDAPERVVLVDADDNELGTGPKVAVHQHGLLHRAVSVFLFDAGGRLLLQRRAAAKYHSAGLWSNSCCGHPRRGEDPGAAAHRRLREEMGVRCPLARVGALVYRAELGGGLVEHEYDHLFVGRFDGTPAPDPAEVGAWRWADVDELLRDVAEQRDRYSAWLPLALETVRARLAEP